jgi:hypothetical protein
MGAMHDKDWLAERFEEQRGHLRAVAYRMLGSLPEADDAVQDAWVTPISLVNERWSTPSFWQPAVVTSTHWLPYSTPTSSCESTPARAVRVRPGSCAVQPQSRDKRASVQIRWHFSILR